MMMLIFLLFSIPMYGSPVSVPCGGTGLSSIAAYAFICGGTTSVGALQTVAQSSTAGQGLVSSGSSALPVTQNVMPGYNVSASNFCYAGTTSNLANTPTSSVLFTTSVPTISTGISSINAIGYQALNSTYAAFANVVAIGTAAYANVTGAGTFCTAVGYNALNGYINTSGSNNVIGVNALKTLTTGGGNNGVGNYVLTAATTSSANSTAVGYNCLKTQTSGSSNTVCGYQAGLLILTGTSNVALGDSALSSNSTGTQNTAAGYNALASVTGGTTVGVGSGAGGANATTGSNNIYIGYQTSAVSAGESNTTVIGNSSHTSGYLYGVTGVTSASGVAVLINSSSKMGTTTSARRFKTNIMELALDTALKLQEVQVVQFNYIADQTHEIHYGMIAEQMVNIFPETVVYDLNGDISTIQYHKFVPILIKFLQNQQEKITQLECEIQELELLLAM
jgi:hypothetical protein